MTASLIDPELRSKGIFFFGELGGFDSALLVRGLFISGVFFLWDFFLVLWAGQRLASME